MESTVSTLSTGSSSGESSRASSPKSRTLSSPLTSPSCTCADLEFVHAARLGTLFRRLSSPSPTAREKAPRDPNWGNFELRLSYKFGRSWAEQTGARFVGDVERSRIYAAAQPWLKALADELVDTDYAPWMRTIVHEDSIFDITSPDYGTSSSVTRTTRLALPNDVGAALAHDQRDIARSALTQVRTRERLGASAWPALRDIMWLLECIMPGMVWFQRVGVSGRDSYRPEPVDRVWMSTHEKRLRRILGDLRYEELLRALEIQEQRERSGSWRW
jgi:hypothetical protein